MLCLKNCMHKPIQTEPQVLQMEQMQVKDQKQTKMEMYIMQITK